MILQIERATSILRQAVQRQLQEFTDAHSAFLKNENHLHPRSLQVAEMRVQLVQDRSRDVARLQPWVAAVFLHQRSFARMAIGSQRSRAAVSRKFRRLSK